jgi:hypothetical protein
MLPSPKDCTACGSTVSTPDNPLMVYSCSPNGIAVGWVHKDCAKLLFDVSVDRTGMAGMVRG